MDDLFSFLALLVVCLVGLIGTPIVTVLALFMVILAVCVTVPLLGDVFKTLRDWLDRVT